MFLLIFSWIKLWKSIITFKSHRINSQFLLLNETYFYRNNSGGKWIKDSENLSKCKLLLKKCELLGHYVNLSGCSIYSFNWSCCPRSCFACFSKSWRKQNKQKSHKRGLWEEFLTNASIENVHHQTLIGAYTSIS